MNDQPGTAGRSARRFAGCAVPLALAAILLAVAVFLRPMDTASTGAAQAQTAQPLVQASQSAAPASSDGLQFPALTGPVVDQANVIPDEEEARLNQKLVALKTQSQRQLQVVTVASLQDYEISDYANRLFREWQLGDKSRNDGVMLLIAPQERRMRIEVGYGMEPIITDGFSFLVINKIITPKFKAGDLPGGIEAGTDALITQLTLPPEQAAQIGAQANAQQAAKPKFNPASLIWVAFVLLFFILPMLRRMRGGTSYRSSGLGQVIMWSVLDGMTRGGGGGGGSGWGGGGGGGGGWGGGGGSSGGGGASGGW